MDSDESSDGAILELSAEYTDLRFTLRHLRSQIDEAEERRRSPGRRAGDDPYLASLREQYSDGKRRVAEIRDVLAPFDHPSDPIAATVERAEASAPFSSRAARTQDEGTEPATYILSGGEEIGDVDVGCSVARAIHSPGVQQFADFLSAFSREDLLQRYEPRRMLELNIYPRLWKEERQEEAFEYLWEYFQILRDFVAEAARRRSGMIVYVT